MAGLYKLATIPGICIVNHTSAFGLSRFLTMSLCRETTTVKHYTYHASLHTNCQMHSYLYRTGCRTSIKHHPDRLRWPREAQTSSPDSGQSRRTTNEEVVIPYRVYCMFPLSSKRSIPDPNHNTSSAKRSQQPQRRPRRRNKRQGLNMRIRKLDPQPLPRIHRRTAQNRPLHLPAPHHRARENPDKLAAYIRGPIHEVLLRSMGCARGIRGAGRT